MNRKIVMVLLFLVPIIAYIVLGVYDINVLLNLVVSIVFLAYCFKGFLKPDNFYSVEVLDTKFDTEYETGLFGSMNEKSTTTTTKYDIGNAEEHINVKYKVEQLFGAVIMYLLANVLSFLIFWVFEIEVVSLLGIGCYVFSAGAPWFGINERAMRLAVVNAERGEKDWHIESSKDWASFKSRLR